MFGIFILPLFGLLEAFRTQSEGDLVIQRLLVDLLLIFLTLGYFLSIYLRSSLHLYFIIGIDFSIVRVAVLLGSALDWIGSVLDCTVSGCISVRLLILVRISGACLSCHFIAASIYVILGHSARR